MSVPHPSNGKSEGDHQSHSRLVMKGSTFCCCSRFAPDPRLRWCCHLSSCDAICPCSRCSVAGWALRGQPKAAGCGLESVVSEREVVQIDPHSQQTGVPSGPGSSPTPGLSHLTRQLHGDLALITVHHPTCFLPMCTPTQTASAFAAEMFPGAPAQSLCPCKTCYFFILLMKLQNKIFHMCAGKQN